VNPGVWPYNKGMSNLKDIPLVSEAARARSGEKYLTPQGFTAIRDGIKAHAAAGAEVALRKPTWLRARARRGPGSRLSGHW